MASNRKPAIVAELGRPETAAETAARKATDSRLYRERKTVNNLVFSLIVSLGAMLIIVLMVPRGVGNVETYTVDVAELAASSSEALGVELVAPEVPESWKPRQAEVRTDGNIDYWYIGYTTVNDRGVEAYAAVVQAFTQDGAAISDEWIAAQLEQRTATGTEMQGGAEWTVYDHSDRSADGSNVLFALEQHIAGEVVLVYGTDTPEAIRTLAASTQASLEKIAR